MPECARKGHRQLVILMDAYEPNLLCKHIIVELFFQCIALRRLAHLQASKLVRHPIEIFTVSSHANIVRHGVSLTQLLCNFIGKHSLDIHLAGKAPIRPEARSPQRPFFLLTRHKGQFPSVVDRPRDTPVCSRVIFAVQKRPISGKPQLKLEV